MDADLIFVTGLEILCLLLFAVLVMITSKFPFVISLLFAKLGVFEIQDSGLLQITKAKSVAGAMITKDGAYQYSKKDIIRWCGISAIIANKDSDARAINPRIAPVLSLMKEYNVDSLEDIESILKAPLVTPEKYEAMRAEQVGE